MSEASQVEMGAVKRHGGSIKENPFVAFWKHIGSLTYTRILLILGHL